MNIIKKVINEKIYAVVRVDDSNRAFEIAEALYSGGIKTIEIVVSNPKILQTIQQLKDFKDLIIVAGGIITQRQAISAISSGAQVLVSPIFQMGLVKYCQNYGTPLIITATTPNEAYDAWKARIPLIKIYPAKPMGGAEYIEDILRPMPFLNVLATGSIELKNIKDYISAGAQVVGVGRAFYKDATLDEIKKRAEFAIKQLN